MRLDRELPAILQGDCLDVMPTLDAESVDAIVTDPPYGLAFMEKDWDHGVPGEHFWREALRVAKPGAHLLAFGGTRTHHRLMCAIEDAGWEIRDCLMWLYGTGFPKSLDIAKAIDKTAGYWRGRSQGVLSLNSAMNGPNLRRTDKGAPITELAVGWQGWGTALKPAWEPIIMARKPLIGTVAANVLTHGTGAINVDAGRVEANGADLGRNNNARQQEDGTSYVVQREAMRIDNSGDKGRWPANVVLDEAAARVLDEQSGELTSGSRTAGVRKGMGFHGANGDGRPAIQGNSGHASRFFYCAKASRSEREAGLEGPASVMSVWGGEQDDLSDGHKATHPSRNHHPTVKPLALMRWLCRLVTPPGGLILDPFCGSGSTGCACILEGFQFLGIEQEAEYVALAEARLRDVAAQPTLWQSFGAEDEPEEAPPSSSDPALDLFADR